MHELKSVNLHDYMLRGGSPSIMDGRHLVHFCGRCPYKGQCIINEQEPVEVRPVIAVHDAKQLCTPRTSSPDLHHLKAGL